MHRATAFSSAGNTIRRKHGPRFDPANRPRQSVCPPPKGKEDCYGDCLFVEGVRAMQQDGALFAALREASAIGYVSTEI